MQGMAAENDQQPGQNRKRRSPVRAHQPTEHEPHQRQRGQQQKQVAPVRGQITEQLDHSGQEQRVSGRNKGQAVAHGLRTVQLRLQQNPGGPDVQHGVVAADVGQHLPLGK